ncbi:hypothetical protein M8J77_002708 [Diaphorina citri]|nr:hypothetical protein M8J77_002708 [Diaphorina citri]
MLAFKSFTRIDDHNYDNIMAANKITSLKNRRDMQDLVFIYKVLHNLIYSPEILSNLNLKVPLRKTRSCDMFVLKKNKTNIGEFSPIQRMEKIGNHITSGAGLDLFSCGLQEIINVFRSGSN